MSLSYDQTIHFYKLARAALFVAAGLTFLGLLPELSADPSRFSRGGELEYASLQGCLVSLFAFLAARLRDMSRHLRDPQTPGKRNQSRPNHFA